MGWRRHANSSFHPFDLALPTCDLRTQDVPAQRSITFRKQFVAQASQRESTSQRGAEPFFQSADYETCWSSRKKLLNDSVRFGTQLDPLRILPTFRHIQYSRTESLRAMAQSISLAM